MNYPKKIKTILKIGCIAAILFNVSAYMTPKPDQVDILNQLIQVNLDRIAGYETASKEVKEVYLKKLFIQFANSSRTYKTELELEVAMLSGKPVAGTKNALKIYQVWMNVKSMVSNHDIETILQSCKYGENITENIYLRVITENQIDLEKPQMDLVITQQKLLNADLKRITSLQNLICVNY
jgi:uncharacterized protein (TIGR02284 family)